MSLFKIFHACTGTLAIICIICKHLSQIYNTNNMNFRFNNFVKCKFYVVFVLFHNYIICGGRTLLTFKRFLIRTQAYACSTVKVINYNFVLNVKKLDPIPILSSICLSVCLSICKYFMFVSMRMQLVKFMNKLIETAFIE